MRTEIIGTIRRIDDRKTFKCDTGEFTYRTVIIDEPGGTFLAACAWGDIALPKEGTEIVATVEVVSLFNQRDSTKVFHKINLKNIKPFERNYNRSSETEEAWVN